MNARGFALVIVLWTLVLLAFVMTHIVATGRTETRIAANLTANADAEAQADGAVMQAVFRLVDASDGHWTAGYHNLNLRRAEAQVTVTPESGKVNPNAASDPLMAALLIGCGAEPAQAGRVAAAIRDWRSPGEQPGPGGAKFRQYRDAGLDHAPPNAPFESLEELQRVMGMTPELFQRLKPHLSLYQTGEPDPAAADPVVAEALRALPLHPRPQVGDQAPRTVSITARVVTDSGGHFLRHAIIRLEPPATQAYALLAWDSEAEVE